VRCGRAPRTPPLWSRRGFLEPEKHTKFTTTQYGVLRFNNYVKRKYSISTESFVCLFTLIISQQTSFTSSTAVICIYLFKKIKKLFRYIVQKRVQLPSNLVLCFSSVCKWRDTPASPANPSSRRRATATTLPADAPARYNALRWRHCGVNVNKQTPRQQQLTDDGSGLAVKRK